MDSKYRSQKIKRKGSNSRSLNRRSSKKKTQKGGRNNEGKIQIGTRGGKNHNLVCKICNNLIFKTQQTLLPRGRLWDWFLGDTFDKSCRVFKCSNCSHINWFSSGVIYNVN